MGRWYHWWNLKVGAPYVILWWFFLVLPDSSVKSLSHEPHHTYGRWLRKLFKRKKIPESWEEYLVHRLLTLLVFLGLLLPLLSLLYVIDELEQVPQVQNHRFSLGRGHIIQPLTQAHTLPGAQHRSELKNCMFILVMWWLISLPNFTTGV